MNRAVGRGPVDFFLSFVFFNIGGSVPDGPLGVDESAGSGFAVWAGAIVELEPPRRGFRI